MEPPWQDADWLSSAHAWIDDRLAALGLERAGEPVSTHVTPWSTVIRVDGSGGTVWFKANSPQTQHEGAVTEILAAHSLALVPPLLAHDAATGWMLQADAGPWLRAETDEDAWLRVWADVLPRYAELQLAARTDVPALRAAGVPEITLASLPSRYAAIVDLVGADARFGDALPRVERLCEELAAFEIPDTIQHDDLHDGQIFLPAGRAVLLDWGDACVSHPFFSLSVAFEGVIGWGLDDVQDSVDVTPLRDAYLAPFEEEYGDGLAPAVDIALRLGWVCRAVNGHVPGDDDHTLTRLAMFVDGTPPAS
jgi:hypothetical protein